MSKKMKKMYMQDSLTILAFAGLFLMFLMLVMSKVYVIAPDAATKSVVIFAGALISAFAVASSIAVIVHIKKNHKNVYSAEI